MTARYAYRTSVKSDASDELINTYVLRPVAGLLVRMLYRTPVTPNQVTIAGMAMGVASAFLFGLAEPASTAWAGICLTAKDILDSADGQLARAKGTFSRAGRFLDSIGDIGVNFAVFSAMGFAFTEAGGGFGSILLCAGAFLALTLRVSYHVYYQTSFLHLSNLYTGNRRSEEVQPGDLKEDRVTRGLQRTFLVLYGWQDRLMADLDASSREGLPDNEETDRLWYGDLTAVRLSGLFGLGTELFVLMLCSVLNRLDLYLVVNLAGMNGLWVWCVWYRRRTLHARIRQGG